MQAKPEASDLDLIPIEEVSRLCGIKRSEIYKLVSAGRFPRQVKISYKVARWQRREVAGWIADRLRERGSSYAALRKEQVSA